MQQRTMRLGGGNGGNRANPPRAAGMNIDLSKLETSVCKICGHPNYVRLFQDRKISAIQSPSGKAEFVMIPGIKACPECGGTNCFQTLEDMENSITTMPQEDDQAGAE